MSKKAQSVLVADIAFGEDDPRGEKVQEIYALSSQTYVVYRANNRVRVIFADDPNRAKLQRDIFAPLEKLRQEIAELTEDWLNADLNSAKALRLQSYNRRLAAGLDLAFRNLPEAAKAALESVRNDLQRERLLIARLQYFVMAVGVAATWVLILAAVARTQRPEMADFFWLLTAIVGTGCFGALFSITLSLYTRKIQHDFLRGQNLMDALLRISLASMSAIVLYVLLRAQLVDLMINGKSLSQAFQGATPTFGALGFLACFLAGFSEKLVGDFVVAAETKLKTAPDAQAKAGAEEAEAASLRAVENTRELMALTGPAGGPAPSAPGVSQALALLPLRGPAGAPAKGTEEEEDHVDGCACDMHDQHDTTDDELPPSRGGLAQ